MHLKYTNFHEGVKLRHHAIAAEATDRMPPYQQMSLCLELRDSCCKIIETVHHQMCVYA